MRYKLVNHPFLVMDFSDFKAKTPNVFADHILSFLHNKIPNLDKFEPSANKTILFLNLDFCYESFGYTYVLGTEDGECVDCIKEISSDMFDIYQDLLKVPEKE
jgi:hypothetical protein